MRVTVGSRRLSVVDMGRRDTSPEPAAVLSLTRPNNIGTEPVGVVISHTLWGTRSHTRSRRRRRQSTPYATWTTALMAHSH